MKLIRRLSLAFCVTTLGQAATAQAQAPLADLLAKNGCAACHAMDRKVVGPAVKEIGAKYRNDKDAPTKLAAKIKAGGSGAWGSMPMPPQPGLKDEDLRAIVKQILELK